MRDELVKNNLLPDIGPVTLSLLVMYSVQFWLTVTKSKITAFGAFRIFIKVMSSAVWAELAFWGSSKKAAKLNKWFMSKMREKLV